MPLKTKVLIILLLMFSLFAALNYGIHHYLILPGFKSLEVSEAKKDMQRCIWVIQNEIHQIDGLCHDWASWDDLYNFIASSSPQFIESNLNMDTVMNNGLNLVCISDILNRTIFCEEWDLDTGKKKERTDLPGYLLLGTDTIDLSPRTEKGLAGLKASGIYNSDKGLMLVSSRPILTRKNQGPARGTLVMGRLLTGTFMAQLRQQTQVMFNIFEITDEHLTSGEIEIVKKFSSETAYIIEEESRNKLLVYSLFPNTIGPNLFLVRAELERPILEKGRTIFIYSVLMFTFLGLFVALLVIVILKKIIISPISILTSHALEVSKSGDLSARIHLSQKDEIGLLGREINRMLGQMEQQTTELAGMNQQLKTDIEKRKQVETELRDSEARFRGLQGASFSGIVIHDQGKIIDVNQAISTITGYTPAELVGMDGFKLIAPAWQATVKSKIAADDETPYDAKGLKKDGSVYPLEIQGKEIPYKGRMVRVTEFRDITTRTLMEKKLKNTLDELTAIIENSQVGIMVLKGGRILYKGNQRLADILGYETPESMIGLRMKELHLSLARFEDYGEKHFNRLVHGEQIQVEYQLKKKDGSPVWCTLSGKAIDPSTPPDLSKGVIWMVDDITEKRQYQDELQRVATTDYLTGLCNRRQFMKLSAIELERQLRYPHCGLSLLMLDIDHFKTVNDTHGHDMGDLLLKQFAKTGQKTLRDVDLFARVGGEEFAILLPSTDAIGAVATAHRFRQAIETSFVIQGREKLSITVSLGVAQWKPGIKDIGEMLKQADHALYVAKQKGRNRVEVYP